MVAKRLYRSGKDKMVAGVCGGIAEYFDVDPVWVRLITVLVTLLSAGIGLVMYIVAWIIIPINPAHKNIKDTEAEKVAKKITEKVETVREERGISKGRFLAGGILILLGFGLLFNMIFPRFEFKYLGPVLLIFIGGYIIWRRSR